MWASDNEGLKARTRFWGPLHPGQDLALLRSGCRDRHRLHGFQGAMDVEEAVTTKKGQDLDHPLGSSAPQMLSRSAPCYCLVLFDAGSKPRTSISIPVSRPSLGCDAQLMFRG